LIVEDPDAPNGVWCHWILYDIGSRINALSQAFKPGSLGLSGENDFGKPGYGGPCPPKGHGDHHYTFTVYALDVDKIEGANAETTGASTVFMMRGHVLAKGKTTGVFGH
jgi:Raf kinase inhibitor-like YbhB/YbcL family protein